MVKRLFRARSGVQWGTGWATGFLGVCVAIGLTPALAASKKAATPPSPPPRSTLPPAFTIPVEPLGFSPPGAFYLGARYSMVSLDFLDETHLLFTFRVPGLIHRETALPGSGDERKIRAVVLRLPEGTIEAETVWTLHDRAPYLYMLNRGQFLLRDRDSLQLGDASLRLNPFLKFPGPVLWVELDPSRQYLVTGSSEPAAETSKPGVVPSPSTAAASVVADDKRAPEEPDMVLRILRRDNGQVMLVSHIRSAVHLPINAEGYLESLRAKGMAWTLNFNHFDGGSNVVGTVDSVCPLMLDFVSNREFLVTGCGPGGDPKLVAMGTDGHRYWEDSGIGPSVWPLLVMSPNGARLARENLLTTHSVTASAPLGTEDIKGQAVIVFDAANGKVALKALASPILDAGGNVAISPSARRVAILMEGGIEVFDLPEPAPLPETSVKAAR